MDCVLMETSAYKELQAHLQRLLERVSALHSLSAQPTTVRWLTAEEVCKALSITKRALQYYPSAGIIPYTGYISAALSYNAVPAVYKARTVDKESFHQE